MPFILRIDVDKPYFSTNLIGKILSKIREDYWFPAVELLGYLSSLNKLLEFLSRSDISAHIYFRRCTLPPKQWLHNLKNDNHMIGLHAENTRNFDSFKKELDETISYFSPLEISSFTKHGSGNLKLGRYHYAPYEPDKYLKWAQIVSVPFLFGNEEILSTSYESANSNEYYPSMFWIDRMENYQDQLTLEWLVNKAKNENVGIMIHPANFDAMKGVADNMKKLVSLAIKENISWITLESSS